MSECGRDKQQHSQMSECGRDEPQHDQTYQMSKCGKSEQLSLTSDKVVRSKPADNEGGLADQRSECSKAEQKQTEIPECGRED